MSATMHRTAEYATHTSAVSFPSRERLRSRAHPFSDFGRVPAHERGHFSALRHSSALERGYWHLWHFYQRLRTLYMFKSNGVSNPAEEDEGKNGFHLDSKEPDWSKFRDFIMGEVRYNSLMKTFPQEAEELFVATERNAKIRYEGYKKLSEI